MSIFKGGAQTVNYLSFDGVNDYVDMGTLGNWASQNINDFAIEITMSANNPSNDDSFFGTLNPNRETTILGDYQDAFRLFVRDDLGSSGPSYGKTITSNIGNVNTYKFEANNGTFNTYLNGNLQDSFSIGTFNNLSNFLYSFIIGARNGSSGPESYSEMNLYDFKIYNGSTLFLHYDMSEGSGNTLVDKAGNNNGTIVGATWQTETVPLAIQNIYYGQPNNYLSFDGIDDYVEFNSSFNNSNTIILYDVNTFFSISKKIPNGHTSVIQYSFDSYPNGPTTQFNALTYVTESGSNYRYFRISDFDQKYDPSVNSKIEIDLDNLQVIIDDTNIYNFNIWLTSGSYIPWDQVNANVRLNFYNRESPNPTNFFIQSKLKLIEFYNDNNLLHQFEMNYIQNQLNDTVGNVVGTIVGATWVSEPNEVSRVYLGSDLIFNRAFAQAIWIYEGNVLPENDGWGIDNNTGTSNVSNGILTITGESTSIWTLYNKSITLSNNSDEVNFRIRVTESSGWSAQNENSVIAIHGYGKRFNVMFSTNEIYYWNSSNNKTFITTRNNTNFFEGKIIYTPSSASLYINDNLVTSIPLSSLQNNPEQVVKMGNYGSSTTMDVDYIYFTQTNA